jgi:hypothetical protein
MMDGAPASRLREYDGLNLVRVEQRYDTGGGAEAYYFKPPGRFRQRTLGWNLLWGLLGHCSVT